MVCQDSMKCVFICPGVSSSETSYYGMNRIIERHKEKIYNNLEICEIIEIKLINLL